MPQEIRVLSCFHCKIFQVDIVKKSKKWQCRVCNIKQTVRKEYFRGSGKECRDKVQELNLIKGQKYNENVHNFLETFNVDENNYFEANEITSNYVGNDENSELNENNFESSPDKGVNNMFNFSQTKKWSFKQNNSEKILKVDERLQNAAKKSKWDNYL